MAIEMKSAASINDNLSPELHVQPLKPGQVKIFRRLIKGKIDPQTKEPIVLSDYWQQGKQMVYDPFKKRSVLLLNATGSRPVDNLDGTVRYEPIVEMIKWDSGGEILCTDADFEKMAYLIRSDLNQSNPYRNTRKKAMYFEVDVAKEQKAEMADFDLMIQAGNWVLDVAKAQDLKTVAVGLGMNADSETLRGDIMKRIKGGEAREVMIASSNNTIKQRIQVQDAEKYGMLIFNDNSGEWFFSDNLEKPICEVPIDVDKVAGLIEFFKDPKGRGAYALLAKKVKKLYEAVD